MKICNLINLHDTIKEPDAKDIVAKSYGYSRDVFYNYLETIRVLRNKCTCRGCMYHMDFPNGIKQYPADISPDCRHNINGSIGVIGSQYLLCYSSSCLW